MYEETLLDEAVRLARLGHTHGRIAQLMRAQGLGREAASRLALRARRIASRPERVKGSLLAFLGLILMVAGSTWILMHLSEPQDDRSRYGMLCIVMGAIFGGLGVRQVWDRP